MRIQLSISLSVCLSLSYRLHFFMPDDTVRSRECLEEEEVCGARQVLAEQLDHAPQHPGQPGVTPRKKEQRNEGKIGTIS